MAMFATLSHGKISSWETIAAAHGHNTRSIEVPNADPKKLGTVEVLDLPGQNLTDRIKDRLAEAGVTKIRKNAVLAFEDLYGASPDYWERQFPSGWEKATIDQLMADPLVKAVEDFVRTKHGDNLVSLCWHFDEKTPHCHVVSIPLVTREHAQRGRKRKDGTAPKPVVKTTLAAKEIRGGSKFALEREHDEWSAFVAHLGLKRGTRGSEIGPEEMRERRLRDPQASRQGEEAARLRKSLKAKEAAGADAMIKMIETGQQLADRLKAEAEETVAKEIADAKAKATAASEQQNAARLDREAAAAARTAADEDRKKAAEERAEAERVKKEAVRRETALKDRETAQNERETAIIIGLEAISEGKIQRGAPDTTDQRKRVIWFDTKLPAEEKASLRAKIIPAWEWVSRTAEISHRMRSKQLEDAEKIRKDGQEVERRTAELDDRAHNLDTRETNLATNETQVERLLAQLNPLIDRVNSVLERLKDAPLEIRRWLNPVENLAKPIGSVLQQAEELRKTQDLVRVRAKGPATKLAEDDLHVQAAYAAQKGGNGL
jgi:hypothetical protein